jgi:TPR repeat protein
MNFRWLAVGLLWLGALTDVQGQEFDANAAARHQEACEEGDAPSCHTLGLMHFYGVGVRRSDARAANLFRRACHLRLPSGCFSLVDVGTAYAEGIGVPRDEAWAVELFSDACEGDTAGGCARLGVMYYEGRGVERDHARAAELFRQACTGFDADSCFNLGTMYASGTGVLRNDILAYALFSISADRGIVRGAQNLAMLTLEMTEQEIADAEALAQRCLETYRECTH